MTAAEDRAENQGMAPCLDDGNRAGARLAVEASTTAGDDKANRTSRKVASREGSLHGSVGRRMHAEAGQTEVNRPKRYVRDSMYEG